ncbi:hypothetical protein SUGI_1042740 [Cryptomeria japonica]|uniref:non-specific lipid transfer protein GPI-anchored 14 n=1 Tax=Cryptomeria japonica TaxID=3369 RepID=UPI002414AFDE|nr:non-specific lipid transfer protein GPI-anchored 14 [Cryptomeria japonica]GLJ49326.1 hypothetical protein SUGI_1042740 [Cryptomeria japonica]
MGENTRRAALVCIVFSCMGVLCAGDLQADQKECSDQLKSLSFCFPFVQGTVKTPSADCCTNLKNVRDTEPKCLCILIKDSTTPALGVSINTALALQMPAACNVTASISDCPALLNLSPSSPDAKVFENANSSSPASPSSSGSESPSSSTSSSDVSKNVKICPEFAVIKAILCSLVILAASL